MKPVKIFLALLCALPLCLQAQEKAEIKYVDASGLCIINHAQDGGKAFERVDTEKYPDLSDKVRRFYQFPTGLAVRFRTDSRNISAKWETAPDHLYDNMTPLLQKGMDLYILRDGKWIFAGSARPSAMENEHEYAIVGSMEPGMKECLMYLPMFCGLNRLEIGVDGEAVIEAGANPFKGKVVVLGSSITHGASASRPGMAYPARLERALGVEMANLGATGRFKLDSFYLPVIADIECDAFIIDAFSNPSAKQIKGRLEKFVEQIRKDHPETPLIFLQTLKRESGNFDLAKRKNESDKRAAADSLMRIIVKKYENVYYIDDAMDIGSDHEGTVDGVHPTEMGFDRILKNLEPQIREILDRVIKDSPLEGVRRAFVEAAAMDYAPNEEMRRRFMEYSAYGKANDIQMMQLYNNIHLPDDEVVKLIEGFDWEKNCWKDIDYAARDLGSWPPTFHVTRMYSLAKLYVSGGNRWSRSEQLGRLLHSALAWWTENMPVCPNWWHNEIGVPKKMGAFLLMMRDELSEEEIAGGLKVMEKSEFGRTGQNKIWQAGNNLMRGLLTDDIELVRKALGYIGEEIFVTREEGVQEDWSFHQHGPQIQFGNYGLSYIDCTAFWLRVLHGSDFAFTGEQTEIIASLIREGVSRSLWKGVMDPSFCGRQNFINAGPGKACAVAIAAMNMAAALEGDEAEAFRKIAEENLEPSLHKNTVLGGSYYWRSDCGIWRRPEWYSSIRMHSERTVGFEFTNMENTLGNFSADGALILMQDGDEFDNIFAYWDWRKLPGTTTYDDGKPIRLDKSREGRQNNSRHVGGLVHDEAMVSAMELERDGLHALKSAFFFDDCVVSLGADIRTSRSDFQSVTTSIDQIHLKGEVVRGKNWVHHAGRGYVSLDGSPIIVSQDVQRGKWDYIDPSFHEAWDEGAVFKAWFEHPAATTGTVPASYAYLLLPCRSASETASVAAQAGRRKGIVKVLRNDGSCQAVQHGKIISAVFHKAGSYRLAGKSYEADGPSIMIIDGSGSKTVCDLFGN